MLFILRHGCHDEKGYKRCLIYTSLCLRQVKSIFIRLIRIYLFYCTSHSLLKTLNGRKTYSPNWEKLLQRGWISWQRLLIGRDLCCNNSIKEGSASIR